MSPRRVLSGSEEGRRTSASERAALTRAGLERALAATFVLTALTLCTFFLMSSEIACRSLEALPSPNREDYNIDHTVTHRRAYRGRSSWRHRRGGSRGPRGCSQR
jgi:hypothetical protein